ncbi:hypothetical protein [Noviherbaspirillum soli]|uniref:hypothetical protein n=1 Tax=Noviherbaspirillum soli TaxID=1064518 RepID=UPI00188D477C|nr:hypothetical protein [Noviherbaspirillum soli]
METEKKARPFGSSGISISDVYRYADGIEAEVTQEVIQLIREPVRDKEGWYLVQTPPKTLTLVDEVVRYIAANHQKSRSYWGAKFSLEPLLLDRDPFEKPKWNLVFARNATALNFYMILRAFYVLLCFPEYAASKYCASIEAAKQAILSVYRSGFVELPPTGFSLPEGVSEAEMRSAITELIWPAAERFNLVVDKIAEIVSASGYRSRVARELAKLRIRRSSVTSLINGLLKHHGRLTVVAVRLSIRQSPGCAYIGETIQKAMNRLIADRRNDDLLKESVGYFWVLQESFKTSFRQRLSTIQTQNLEGGAITLHYDLVMFFDAKRFGEVKAIATHLGACWKVIAGEAASYRILNGKNLSPYPADGVSWREKITGRFPMEAEFVGLVRNGSIQASNLRAVAAKMVFSAVLRKPSDQSPTLIKSKTRRFGKSDLLTGCGFDKAGRGNNSGHSGAKHERKRRPKYVAPDFGGRLDQDAR